MVFFQLNIISNMSKPEDASLQLNLSISRKLRFRNVLQYKTLIHSYPNLILKVNSTSLPLEWCPISAPLGKARVWLVYNRLGWMQLAMKDALAYMSSYVGSLLRDLSRLMCSPPGQAPGLARKHYSKIESPVRDKHSSLFGQKY